MNKNIYRAFPVPTKLPQSKLVLPLT